MEEGYLFKQTVPYKSQGTMWCGRTVCEYIQAVTQLGFTIERYTLVTYPAHRFFKKYIAKLIYNILTKLSYYYIASCVQSNLSYIFGKLSSLFIKISGKPLGYCDKKYEGNTFFVFVKK